MTIIFSPLIFHYIVNFSRHVIELSYYYSISSCGLEAESTF